MPTDLLDRRLLSSTTTPPGASSWPGLAAAGLLAACGNSSVVEAAAPATDGYPREVVHVDGVTTIPTRPERIVADGPANVEAVARARPDLIIGRASAVDDVRAELEQLAPVLVLEQLVLANITILGEALDLADRAAEVLAAYEARLADGVRVVVIEQGPVAQTFAAVSPAQPRHGAARGAPGGGTCLVSRTRPFVRP